MSLNKVAVILPSRGLIFSQTADEILQNLRGIPHKFYFAHKLPIPQCFEKPTCKAIFDEEITHLWFIEDDMVVPPDTLKMMLDMDVAVVTADYPVNPDGRGAVFKDKGGKVIFTGTGCLLVKKQVFDELKAPYFRTDIRWTVKNMGGYIKLHPSKMTNIDGYGLHDVNFCMNLNRLGIPIHVIPKKLAQRKLISLGKAGSNDGAHNIEIWKKITANHLLKQVMKWPPTETGNLVTVLTPTGEINCSASHAKKLIRKGLAKRPPRRHSVIDWGSL